MQHKEYLIFIPALDNYFMVAPFAFKTFSSREAAKKFIDNADSPVFNNAIIKEITMEDYNKINLLGCGSIIGIAVIIILTVLLVCI